MKPYYPLMIDLSNRPCVVIGGGNVAERKIITLLEAKARITVVSPKVSKRIEDLSNDSSVQWLKREYKQGDLKDNFIVIIATDNSVINKIIYNEVDHSNQLVNIVDTPNLCTFIVPSSIKRGYLQITVSTNGASPGLTKKIKQDLETLYGQEYEEYTEFLADMREWILNNINIGDKKAYFLDLLTEENLLKIKSGDRLELEKRLKNQYKKGKLNKDYI